jgi:hypothetical protein
MMSVRYFELVVHKKNEKTKKGKNGKRKKEWQEKLHTRVVVVNLQQYIRRGKR